MNKKGAADPLIIKNLILGKNMNQEDKGGGVERILNLIYTPVNYFVFIHGDLNYLVSLHTSFKKLGSAKITSLHNFQNMINFFYN